MKIYQSSQIIVFPHLLGVALLTILLGCRVDPETIAWDTQGLSTTTPIDDMAIKPPSQGITYYIRPDGGNTTQCNGQADVPYPGSGAGQACAWDHPFRALPPGDLPRISGGDTLVITSGQYRMGYGAPGSEATCEPESAYDCHMTPIPSGPDANHPTRLLGATWETGCSNPPELWGAERPWFILNLAGSSNVEIACLEITDHSSCVESHTGGLSCQRDSPPYGDWAPIGLYAEDSKNVILRQLNIHGLASTGIHAGRLTDWTVEDVRLASNGWSGWDGDIEGDDSNSGTLVFRRWIVEWNGCAETYPQASPAGCWSQSAGGYGDGVGTGATGGNWLIEDSAFLHNTSDGLDLLYHQLGGSIRLNRVRAEGNAGNPIKATGQVAITNSLLVANCAFFEGQPFTYQVDACRALGNALEISFTGGEQASLINNTFYGQGDGLLAAGPRDNFTCSGSEGLFGRNNLFLGDQDFFDPSDLTFLFFFENCANLNFDSDYSLYYQVKLSQYNPGPHDLQVDPQLSGPLSGETYGFMPVFNSPAIDSGDSLVCPGDDFSGQPRPQDGDNDGEPACDIGAYEWSPPDVFVFLPLVQR